MTREIDKLLGIRKPVQVTPVKEIVEDGDDTSDKPGETESGADPETTEEGGEEPVSEEDKAEEGDA